MKNVKKILEIDKIIQNIASFNKTTVGKDLTNSLKYFHSKDRIKEELFKLNEMMDLLSRYGEIPISSSLDLEKELKKVYQGFCLDELSLMNLKEELITTKDILIYINKNKIEPNYLKYVLNLKYNDHLFNRIINTISNDGEILDKASNELSLIRRRIMNLNKELKNLNLQLINKYQDKLTQENVVLKNGHFALPIQTSLKNSINGIILDISSSGQTTFIEPSEVLELENKINLEKLKERDEITRILKEITDEVLNDNLNLVSNNKNIGEIDFLISKAKYAFSLNAVVPEIINQKKIAFYEARHPLLDQNVVIPNDFILGNNKTLMLISGPNAGGKTIALKTIAVLVYMVNMGLAIPVNKNSSLGIFNNIYIDIGDSQSIEANLSTFSGHISNLSVIFKHINSNDLIFIDELGSGTDPKEGEALSISIAKFLLKKRCLSFITSHFSLLKKFGLSNPNVLNASFIFNEKQIKPTFKMMLGVSGSSYGFLIAKKYGLSQEIINEAKDIYSENYLTSNDLKIEELERKERELIFKEKRINEKERKIELNLNEIKNKENNLKIKEEKLKNRKLDDFDDYIDKMYDNVNNVYEEFKKTKDIKKAEEKLDILSKKEIKNESFLIGDYVEVIGIGAKGKIIRMNKDKISVSLDNGFSLNTTTTKIKKLQSLPSKIEKRIDIDSQIMNQKQISFSLNLIGLRVNVALETLDHYLDDCRIRGLKNIRIIHGFGTGRLKEGIHSHLKTLDFVDSFRIGNELDGGSGSTIITLK